MKEKEKTTLERIKECRKTHKVKSCGECPVLLQCFLIDEMLSIRTGAIRTHHHQFWQKCHSY